MEKAQTTDRKFTKASIKTPTDQIINRISADKNVYVYELIEEVFKKVYPQYFQNEKLTINV
jgi:hypothetical protein